MGDFADDALMNAEIDWLDANDDRLSMEERYDRGFCDEMGFERPSGPFIAERLFISSSQATRIISSKPNGKGKCPKCNCETVLKEGKFGKFYGCVKFPACKGSRNI